MGYDDPGRNNKCWPQQPIAAARFDREKIKCFYRCMCFCFNLEDLASRTYLDVYSNGILVNVPTACCCCCVKDSARFIFYDGKLFGREPSAAGCCNPFPYPCPNCFNVCGNVLAFRPGSCVGCPDGGMHGGAAICLACIPVCPYDALCGLVEGEATRLSAIIMQQKTAFDISGKVVPKPIVQGGHPNQMHIGGLATSML
jgi:hypothetical protein